MNQPVTLSQVFLFVLLIAVIILIYDLKQTLAQFRKTLSKADEAFDDLRATLKDVHHIVSLVRERTESLSNMVQGFERTAGKLTAVLDQLTAFILKPVMIISSVVGGMKAALSLFGSKKQGGKIDVERE